MSIFLSCAHWALYVIAVAIGLAAVGIAALARTAHRAEERPGAWFLASYCALAAGVVAGLVVAAGYIR